MLRPFACLIAGLALVLPAVADEPLKSGPPVGSEVPGPFFPLNVTGPFAGKKACLYCANAGNPVAVVFAREATPEVALLLKKLDEATAKHAGSSLGSYAVFCTDNKDLRGQLTKLAEQQKLEHLILSLDTPAGPTEYKIAPAADVTVLLYDSDAVVRANYALPRGALTSATVERIVADVPKILAK